MLATINFQAHENYYLVETFLENICRTIHLGMTKTTINKLAVFI